MNIIEKINQFLGEEKGDANWKAGIRAKIGHLEDQIRRASSTEQKAALKDQIAKLRTEMSSVKPPVKKPAVAQKVTEDSGEEIKRMRIMRKKLASNIEKALKAGGQGDKITAMRKQREELADKIEKLLGPGFTKD